jgi:predicted RNA methylase
MSESIGAMNIECPATMRRHVQQVLGGEYDVRYRATQPGILDIGANVGSFAAWALKRWPACYVHCYEPLPDNFALLKKNLGQVRGSLGEFAQLCGRRSEPEAALSRPQQLRGSMLEYHSEANRRKGR